MKYNLLLLFVVGCLMRVSAQSPRLSLFEEFTGETCPPCASTNATLNPFLAQPSIASKCIAIKWQVPIPSAPTKTWSLYQTNKAEIDWRAFSYGYGINFAPSAKIDGQSLTVFGLGSDSPQLISSTHINTAQSYTSAFTINLSRAWAPGCTAVNVTVNIQATAGFTATGNLVFRTVMIERLINFSVQPGTNGETSFEDVAIKSFPTIQGGVTLPTTWTNGQTHTFTLSCAVPSYTRKKNQIAMVGFIQDDGNRKVAQAARTTTATVPPEALAMLGASVNLACTSNITPTVSVRNDGPSAISTLTITPYSDNVAGTPVVWNGNLAPGASTTIVLTGVTAASAPGPHVFSYDAAMNAPLYNLTVNNNSTTYLVSSSYIGSQVSQGFVPSAFPPAGWTQFNKDNGPAWSKLAGSGAYGTSSECAKYNFYANAVVGDQDELFLPPSDLSSVTGSLVLSMDIAHAQRNNSNDKLEVMVSDNCGASWTTVFSQAGSALATITGGSSSSYAPDQFDPTHWKTEIVPLNGFNKASLLVKFVTTSDNGNNLYIDNVNLGQSTVGLDKRTAGKSGISIYPNPAGSYVNVRVESASAGESTLSVTDITGKLVYQKAIQLHNGATVIRLNTEEFASGVYAVTLDTNGERQVQKLTVSK